VKSALVVAETPIRRWFRSQV